LYVLFTYLDCCRYDFICREHRGGGRTSRTNNQSQIRPAGFFYSAAHPHRQKSFGSRYCNICHLPVFTKSLFSVVTLSTSTFSPSDSTQNACHCQLRPCCWQLSGIPMIHKTFLRLPAHAIARSLRHLP